MAALVDARDLSYLFCPGAKRGSADIAASQSPPANPAVGGAQESDEDLMRRYQRGDEQAFHRLYDRHRASLHRFIRRLVPASSDHHEILQETWMAVIRGRERYRPQARFVTYLFSIGRRRAMDHWRKLGRAPELEPDAEDLDGLLGPTSHEPEPHAAAAALRADLMTAIAALPILQREVFLLRAEGDLTLEEIGEATGAGRETAKSRLRYALNRLRISLGPWHDE